MSLISLPEFAARREQTRDRLAEFQLDAVVASGISNFRYLTGYFPLLSESPTRPWFVVIPNLGDATAVVPTIGAGDLRNAGWTGEIVTWDSPNPVDEGVSALAGVLSGLDSMQTRVGFERGPESRLGMAAADYESLLKLTPWIEPRDASTLLWNVRATKSTDEIACIRAAASAFAAGLGETEKILASGGTETAYARHLTHATLTAGADELRYLACCSGQCGYESITRAASNRQTSVGDVIAFDGGARVEGYWCDFDRNYGIGHVSSEAHAAHHALWEATEIALQIARPGVRALDLWVAMARSLESFGFESNRRGRYGHGVGLDFTEPPSIAPGDHTRLRKAMVLSIEPSVTYASAAGQPVMMCHEEMIVVTEDGCQLLTPRATSELTIVR